MNNPNLCRIEALKQKYKNSLYFYYEKVCAKYGLTLLPPVPAEFDIESEEAGAVNDKQKSAARSAASSSHGPPAPWRPGIVAEPVAKKQLPAEQVKIEDAVEDSDPDPPTTTKGNVVNKVRRDLPKKCPWGGPTEGDDQDEGYLWRNDERYKDYSADGHEDDMPEQPRAAKAKLVSREMKERAAQEVSGACSQSLRPRVSRDTEQVTRATKRKRGKGKKLTGDQRAKRMGAKLEETELTA